MNECLALPHRGQVLLRVQETVHGQSRNDLRGFAARPRQVDGCSLDAGKLQERNQ